MASPATALPVADPPAFLAGEWRIHREVHDAREREDGVFTGVATFSPAPHGLSWVEEGVLTMPRFAFRATREMQVVRARKGARAPWEVRFADGRPFHPLDLRDGRCPVDHPCGEDHYSGWVLVEHAGRMVVSWRVVGPRKDHTILTRYER